MPPLHVDHNCPPLQPHPIRGPVRTLHVLFVFVLHKGKPATLPRGLVHDQLQVLDGTVRLHLAEQLALRDLVGQASHEEGVVAVHAVGVLAAACLLLLAVRLDRGRERRVVCGLLGLDPVLLEALRGGIDLALGGTGPLEVREEGGDAGQPRPAL